MQLSSKQPIRLTFLGTGTSTGVPQVGCNCQVCRSDDTRDRRLRSSVLIEIAGHNLLIDCGPDFRQQILRCGSPNLDALLVTHSHYDHLGGIDDLRPYCYRDKGFPVYCQKDVAHDIRTRMPYCFGKHHYPGAPIYDIHIIGHQPFDIDGIRITPLPVMHTETLEITGFRIGGLSYITDCKTMPESTMRLLQGSDTLVINGLRYEEHHTHLNVAQAIDIIDAVSPRRALLTHMSHQIGRHTDVNAKLPDNVVPAYDGLTIEIPSVTGTQIEE